MKVGFRKPSIKKSISARTTGRLKRSIKKAIIPGYGKKGIGWIKNPKKAIYNKIYHKTTKSIFSIPKFSSNSSKKNINTEPKSKNKWVALLLCIFTIFGHKFYEGKIKMGILYLFTCGLFGIGWIMDIIKLISSSNPYYV